MGIAFYTMFFVAERPGAAAVRRSAGGCRTRRCRGIAIEAWGLDVLRARRSGNLIVLHLHTDPGRTGHLRPHACCSAPSRRPCSPASSRRCTSSAASPSAIGICGPSVSPWQRWSALKLFLSFGKEGQFLIAVADNAKLAELYGISARRAYCVTAAIAGIFITLAMYLSGARSGITPNSPMELILTAVIGTLLGGMGRVFMGGLASLVLALIQSYSGPGDRLPLAEPADSTASCSSPSCCSRAASTCRVGASAHLHRRSGADRGAGKAEAHGILHVRRGDDRDLRDPGSSYNLVIGYGGLATVAHPIFFALGAYTAGSAGDPHRPARTALRAGRAPWWRSSRRYCWRHPRCAYRATIC